MVGIAKKEAWPDLAGKQSDLVNFYLWPAEAYNTA